MPRAVRTGPSRRGQRGRRERRSPREPGRPGPSRNAGGSGHAPAPARRWPNDPYGEGEPRYRVFRRALRGELGASEIIAQLKEAGLRGMGGAGFPTASKWELVAAQTGDSEVRDLQRRRVRAGHLQGPPDPLRRAASRARGAPARDVRDRRGAGLGLHPPRIRPRGGGAPRRARGAPVRGTVWEATCSARVVVSRSRCSRPRAATSSARSRRCSSASRDTAASHATSRRFPGVSGLWGRPTLINNVETLVRRAHHRRAGRRPGGASRASTVGAAGSSSPSRATSRRPGVYCVPSGTTIGDLIAEAGGVKGGAALGAVQPGGASSNFLGAGPDRRASRFRTGVRRRLDARVRGARRRGRGNGSSRGGDQRPAFLPQRVVRQVRALSSRVRTRRTRSCPKTPRPAPRPGRARRANRRARGDDAAHVDLRPRTSGPRSGHERRAARARYAAGLSDAFTDRIVSSSRY